MVITTVTAALGNHRSGLCEAPAEDDGPQSRRERNRARTGRRGASTRTGGRRRNVEPFGDFA